MTEPTFKSISFASHPDKNTTSYWTIGIPLDTPEDKILEVEIAIQALNEEDFPPFDTPGGALKSLLEDSNLLTILPTIMPLDILSYQGDDIRGPIEFYDETTGDLEQRGFLKDIVDGKWVLNGHYQLYMNGKLFSEGEYKNGAQIGEWYFPQQEDPELHHVWFEGDEIITAAASSAELQAKLIYKRVSESPSFELDI